LDNTRGLLPQIRDRDIDGCVRPQSREPRIHQSAGLILLVCEQSNHFFPCRLVQQGEQLFAPFGTGLLDNVRRIVRREQPYPDVSLLLRQNQQQGVLVMGAGREEKIRLLARMQFTKLLQTLLVGQVRPAIPELIRCNCKLGGHFDSASELIMQTVARPL